ncbi:MAG TPA: LamG domain-containing protein [Kofleriaceae bacterium]|nr:LamG domain-containing protein [Kofleriaceae bacterium]
MVRSLLVAALVTGGACRFDGDHGGASFRCDDQPICPAGFTCIDGWCRAQPIDAGGDLPDGGLDVPPVLGDLITYTFDDYEPTDVAHDRSGARRDGSDRSLRLGAGRYGQGLALGGSPLDIPDSPALFRPGAIALEMWVFRDRVGVREALFSDHDAAEETADTELSFEIGPEDRLELLVAPDCDSNGIASAASEGTIPAATWTHAAAVWEGDQVTFYIDGEPAGTAPLSGGCQRSARFAVGARNDGSSSFQGAIDEVKISSTPRPAELIRASMAHDSQAAPAACGDLLIEGEGCDGPGLCCAGCQLRPDDTACNGELGRCQSGVCRPVEDLTRVADGLVALYTFGEGMGAQITDSSGQANHLVIGETAGVAWGSGTLTLIGSAAIASAEEDGPVAACVQSGEVTVEAWVAAASTSREGRLVGVVETGAINLSLSQAARAWTAGVRSSRSLENGHPVVDTPPETVTTDLTHLVMARSADGWRRLYVDGVLRGSNPVAGDLAWAPGERFVLGADADGSDSWRGTYHLVAVYCRALDELEVAQNFSAGAD